MPTTRIRSSSPPGNTIPTRRAPWTLSRLVGGATLAIVLSTIAPSVSARGAATAAPAEDPSAGRTRNVLFVLADTLSPFHLGCYGYDRDVSPSIDRLAAEGVVFDRAWSAAAWTKPAIPSLFTGRFPSEHGVFEGSSRDREGAISSDVLDGSWTTLAESLRDAGWRTGAFVENAQIRGFLGFDQGFDVYDDDGGTAAELFARCQDWLASGDDRPYFAYVHLLDVHWPYRPPAPYDTRFGEATDTFLDEGDPDWKAVRRAINRGDQDLDEVTIRRMRDLYDGEIAWMDAAIGDALRRFRDLGLLEDTLVVLTADHGEEFGEHGKIGHGQSLRETLVRIPLIVSGPGLRASRTRAPASLVDLFPTLLDALGRPLPDATSGRSLRAALAGDAGPEVPLFAERRDLKGRVHEVAVRLGSWKLVRRWKLRDEAAATLVPASAVSLPSVGSVLKVKLADEEGSGEDAFRIVESAEPHDDHDHAVKGTILEVDPARRRLVVSGVAVALVDDTELGAQDGPAPTFEELHVGQRVKVKGTYDPNDDRLEAESVKLYREETGRDRLEGPVAEIDRDATPPRFRMLGRWLVLAPDTEVDDLPADLRAIAPLFAPARLMAPDEAFDVTDSLVDLDADPRERTDLLASHSAEAARLRDALHEWLGMLQPLDAPTATEALDPEMLRALEELGYLK